TANELQSRAREYLEQLESELENKRKELGVDDALKTVPGVTSKMLVKFGESDIKTVEDLAGCATDDLVGWTERKEGGEPTKHAGILDGNEVSRADACRRHRGVAGTQRDRGAGDRRQGRAGRIRLQQGRGRPRPAPGPGSDSSPDPCLGRSRRRNSQIGRDRPAKCRD